MKLPSLSLRACVVGLLFLLVLGCSNDTESLSWHVEETHRWAELTVSEGNRNGFGRVDSASTGVGFVNTLSTEAYLKNRHLVNGSGVAIGDVTGDGWPDIYLARLDGPNALYVNEGTGDLSFRKVPEAGGAALRGEYSTGVVLADVTGTGPLDLLVTTLGGPNVVFVNEGGGKFQRMEDSGLQSGQGSTTMALADLNGDEALDLYVANYKEKTIKDELPPSQRRFEDVVVQTETGEYRVRDKFQADYDVRRQGNRLMRFEVAESDRVYFNTERRGFAEQEWGSVFREPDGSRVSEVPRDWGLVVRLEDLNGDGEADLYVCNDFESPDFYYLGQEGVGRMKEAAPEVLRTTSHSTMSIATTDVNRDGNRDFFLADMLGRSYERRHQQVGVGTPIPREVGDETVRMQEMQNTFQLNRGDGTHVEISQLAGIEASGWTWSSAFLDVNLDGYSDLIASNGHAYDAMHADTEMQLRSRGGAAGVRGRDLLKYPDLDLRNVAFRNEGDGTFSEVEEGWGLGEEADVSHGMARGDLDRDGDRDVVINRLNRPVGIYRNESTGARLAVQLTGRAPNTRGIGASVTVEPEGGSVPAQEKAVIEGGEYLSDSGEVLTFAMGEATEATIQVEWPTGEETEIEGQVGRLYDVRQSGAEPEWGSRTDHIETSQSSRSR